MSIKSSKTVVEQISDKIFDRLQVLMANQHQDLQVSEVVRPSRSNQTPPKHLQVVFRQDEEDEIDDLMRPGNPPGICYEQKFEIICITKASEKDPTPLDQYRNAFLGRVIEAVTQGRPEWYSFNGLAVDSYFGPMEREDVDYGDTYLFKLPLMVRYRVSEYSPFEVRT